MKAPMPDVQKAALRELLRMCVECGFGSSYPLAPIAEKLGLKPVELYDVETNTGLLWELGPYGDGLIDVSHDGLSAGVSYDTHQLLAHWCDFRH